jgi:hypothetical protein
LVCPFGDAYQHNSGSIEGAGHGDRRGTAHAINPERYTDRYNDRYDCESGRHASNDQNLWMSLGEVA